MKPELRLQLIVVEPPDGVALAVQRGRDGLLAASEESPDALVFDFSLTVAEREQWRRARRKRGRPKVGQGFKRVSVSLEKGLLKRATALAKKRRLSRSKLFAQMLESALVESQ